jgi:photosystem II stability/assembly factor-like uncharacterized protein
MKKTNFFVWLIFASAMSQILQNTCLLGQPSVIPSYKSLPWNRTGGPPGGLGYDIRYNFANTNLWYVTDNFAGIHMSTDRGLNWFPSTTGITVRSNFFAGDHIPIFCCTVDPIDPNIVWIGTNRIGRILKSTEKGYSWTLMDNGVDKTMQSLSALSFRGFSVHPANSNIVYAMAEIASWGWTPDRSQRTGAELDMTQGIVYKTTDGGKNWKEIWRGNNLARYCWIDPRDPEKLFVSTGIFDRESANTDTSTDFPGGVGIIRSTDGGTTWEELNQKNGLADLYIGSLFMHPTDPDVLLAAASQNHWSYFNPSGKYAGGIYQTIDGGDHWELVLLGESTYKGAGWGEQFGVVEISTKNPNIAYAISDRAVYRSEWKNPDGYRAWKTMNRPNNTWGSPGMMAGIPIDAQCDPEDPMRIFVNNYLGGNFLSADGGETWVSATKGYTGAEMKNIDCSSLDNGIVYAGARTGIFSSIDGGATWEGINKVVALEVSGADTTRVSIPITEIMNIAVDPTDDKHVLVSGINRNSVFTTWDGGKTWILVGIPGFGTPASAFAFSPSNPSIVFAAAGIETAIGSSELGLSSPLGSGLFVSKDKGKTWASVSGETLKDKNVQDVAVHPRNSNIIYTALYSDGTHNKTMYKSTDGGLSWNLSNSGLPNLPIISLAIAPSNPEIIFAGLYKGSVYKSTNAGGSWYSSSSGMNPEEQIPGIEVDPFDSQIVYAGSRTNGVYLSMDGGTSWSTMNDGLKHHAVNTLCLSKDGSVLYAGVWGDGVYRLGTSTIPPTDVDRSKDNRAIDCHLHQNYPNPFNPAATIHFSVPNSMHVILKVYDLRGRETATLVDAELSAGEHVVRFDASGLPGGVYFYRIRMGEFQAVKKMVLMK